MSPGAVDPSSDTIRPQSQQERVKPKKRVAIEASRIGAEGSGTAGRSESASSSVTPTRLTTIQVTPVVSVSWARRRPQVFHAADID